MSAALFVAAFACAFTDAPVDAPIVETVVEILVDGAADSTADADFYGYYDGEFAGAAAIVGSGVVSMAAGGALAFVDDEFVKGAAGALLIGGALAAGGFAVYLFVIPGIVEDGLARFEADPRAFKAAEMLRMHDVIERFTPLRLTTAALTMAAVVTAFFGKAVDNDVVAGAGLGAAVTTLSLFIYDSAAAGRGRDYLAALTAE